jgi:large subunit ribosomal protein L32
MPVPKRKTSKSRRDKRHANSHLFVGGVATCPNCSQPCISHAVCKECGFFKGRKIMTTKTDRALQRAEVRQAAAKKAPVAPAEPEEVKVEEVVETKKQD